MRGLLIVLILLGVMAIQAQTAAPPAGTDSPAATAAPSPAEASAPAAAPAAATPPADQTPPVAKAVLEPAKVTAKPTEAEDEDDEKTKTVPPTLVAGFVALFLLGIGQQIIFASQAGKLRKTVAEQTAALETATKNLALSAAATADSAETLKVRTAQHLRAYLTVVTGTAIYQDSGRGLRFEGKPLLVNVGQTAAVTVAFKIKAGILPVPLPEDFAFPLLDAPFTTGALGPRDHMNLSGVVEYFVNDADVEMVKAANGTALYVWGEVAYEDVFGDTHRTQFCQQFAWGNNNATLWANDIVRFSEAT